MGNKAEIIKVLAYLAALFPRFELTEATGDAYHDMLQDVPPDLLKAAAQQYATNGKFFPSVAELRQAAFEIRAQALGIPSIAEAWGEVMHQIRNVGSWGEDGPEFSSPLIYSAVDALGGWMMLCRSDNNMADRAHFLKIYSGLLERSRSDAAMLPEVREVMGRLAEKLTVPQLEEEARC